MNIFKIGVSFSLLSIMLFGCATRNPTDHTFRESFQSPEIELDLYKDPETRSEEQQQDVSVVVAISGGGYRSGNFATGVLQELETIECGAKKYNALQEIDYFSTVSGGGIAAAVYTSTLIDHMNENKVVSTYSLRDELLAPNANLMRELERGRHNILFAGLISLITLGPLDRGDFLQREFDKYLLGSERRGRSLTLGDLFVPVDSIRSPTSPMWIANATVFENGSIFPFYPKAVEEYEVSSYTHCLREELLSDPGELPLSIGLKASSSFPLAVPATTLESSHDRKNRFIHLFDGGQSDNLGVLTALKILDQTETNKKVLIIIDSYVGQSEPFSGFIGSPTALRAAARASTISLDAWRIRYKWILDEYIDSAKNENTDVSVVYLSFDDLDSLTKNKLKKIGTNFNISESEQKLLFQTAAQVVNDKKKELMSGIFSTECS